MSNGTILYSTHEACLDHDAGRGHPERPGRLGAVAAGIERSGLGEAVIRVVPRPARRDELLAVHSEEFVDAIEGFCRSGGGQIDADTAAVPASWEAALRAAGAGPDAVDQLRAGDADAAFVAVRPPGHHATPRRAMGFCLLNNVAITAAGLAGDGERVLVVDFDAHHGNGTQDAFYADGRVAYLSLHEWPQYPGTGWIDETGAGAGEGTTVNLPLPSGATGDVYLDAFDRVVAPLAARFAPTWLLVSAGFDAHFGDPLTDLGLSAGDFGLLTARLLTLVPAGRVVVLLEGGYNLEALESSTAATVAALAGERLVPEAPTSGGPGRDMVERVSRLHGISPAAPPTAGQSGGGLAPRSHFSPEYSGAARSPRVGLNAVIPERLRPLLAETEPVAALFDTAGKRLFLVGGIVRDAVLGRLRDDSDLDFTTDALPDEIESIVAPVADAVWTQGKRFGTIGLRLSGRNLEITTHRAEAYHPDSRKPDVVFAGAVEADLSRRDFTVNAMALSLPDLTLVDPFDGVGDLAAGRLRTPLGSEESFGDDPLRMLRAARFVAGYGLVPDSALFDAVVTLRSRLDIVSDERIRDELDKLMVVPAPGEGLWFLVRTGLAEEFLPELPALALEADPVHRHKDVLAHTIAVVDKTSPERLLRLAALFHDVGKPKTRSFGPRGAVSFHHHEVVGARMTRDRMRALRYPGDDIEVVSRLVELHLRFHTYRMGWTDSAVRRYVRDAGPLLGHLNELTRCDCTTRNAAKAAALDRRMDELEERIEELQAREELAALRPDLDGVAVMARLGIPPGRAVGEALEFLLELRLEEGPLGEAEAGRRLDEWWAGRQDA